MPGYEQRASILQGEGEIIFNMVCDRATPQQWAEWLRAPLEHAAGTANAGLVEKLLRAGADGSAGWNGCDGHTMLHACAEGGDEQVMADLMRAGSRPDVNARARGSERTPLHVAAAHGKVAAAKVLILAGAVVNGRDARYDAPLHLAMEGGHAELAENLLLSGAHPHLEGSLQMHPIHLAARQGLAGVARNLLHKGVDVNVRASGEATALLRAVDHGCVSTVQVFLDAGADTTLALRNGGTPLHTAAYKGKGVDMITALVEAGADMEARTATGDTPLLTSARRRLSGALLQLGANVNAKSYNGSTPLHAACSRRKASAVDQLLRWGADETAIDIIGRTPGQRIPSMVEAAEDDRPVLERLSKLLEFAPQDRAWRRRGFFVLCRAHPDRAQLARDISSNAGPPGQSPERPTRRSRVGHEEIEVTAGGPQLGVGGGSASTSASTGRTSEGTRSGFDGVAAWLTGLTDENVFRSIVAYL